jgi:superfamily II DNA helicase RecQ
VQGEGGWIVATRALGTEVNMARIVYVLHMDQPYRITSFVQQLERGGQNRAVSNLVVFIGVKTTCG